MFFGLFEGKATKYWREETIRTINDASWRFDNQKKKSISKKVLKRILELLKQIDGLPARDKKEIIIQHTEEIAKERRQNINSLQFDNPKWVEVAMTESFYNMYSGVFGKKLSQEAVMVIYWCRTHLSEKEIDTLVKNSGLSKDKIFGDKL
tara:strand:- start:12 stop:461 length:450 start_codon:yes stop_codon:yes gene_type:complete